MRLIVRGVYYTEGFIYEVENKCGYLSSWLLTILLSIVVI